MVERTATCGVRVVSGEPSEHGLRDDVPLRAASFEPEAVANVDLIVQAVNAWDDPAALRARLEALGSAERRTTPDGQPNPTDPPNQEESQ